MKRVTWKLVFLPILFVLLQGSGCGDDTENPLAEGEEFRASITLTESDLTNGECIHMFAPGEDFPCCQICRQNDFVGSRGVNIDVTRGSSLVFRAGRNGVILDTQSCTVPTNTSTSFSVVWLGAGLDCGTNW